MRVQTTFVILMALNAGCFDLSESPFNDEGKGDGGPVPNGDLEWAISFGGKQADMVGELAVANDGRIAVAGLFSDVATFGEGPPGDTTLDATDDGTDIFLAQYTAGGDLDWVRGAGGAWSDGGTSTTILDDTIFLAGYFGGSDFYEATFGAEGDNSIDLHSYGESDVFVAAYDKNGDFLWVKQAGGVLEDFANDIVATQADGAAVLVTGGFNGEALFGDPEEGLQVTLVEDNPTQPPLIDDNMFIAAYTIDGDLVWAEQPVGNSIGNGISAFSDGSFVVAGQFALDLALDSETNLTALEDDGFLARYDTEGNVIWAKRAGSDSSAMGNDVVVHGQAIIFWGGYFCVSVRLGLGETNEAHFISHGDEDGFLARVAADTGDLEWAVQLGGEGFDSVSSVTAMDDGSGSVLVTGSFEETLILGQGDTNETTLLAEGEEDAFIALYDVSGALVWARREGGSRTSRSSASDGADSDSVVVGGWFNNDMTVGAGESHETVLEAVAGESAETAADGFLMRLNVE